MKTHYKIDYYKISFVFFKKLIKTLSVVNNLNLGKNNTQSKKHIQLTMLLGLSKSIDFISKKK